MPNNGGNSPLAARSSEIATRRARSWSVQPIIRSVTTITTVAALGLVSACGIRLETTPPAELVPSSDEIARQALVTDLALIEALATESISLEPVEATKKTLNKVLDATTGRSEALGGVYESGLPQTEVLDEEASLPAPGETGVEASALSTATKLYESAARIRTSLDLAQDGNLARITASVGIAHALEAQSLAKSAGQKISKPEALTPTPWDATSPQLTEDQYIALIRSEDFAGYAYEVSAAMSEPDGRASMLSAARTHRAQANTLAILAEVAGTPKDPRLVAYELPFELSADTHVAPAQDIKKFLREVESTLATDYLDLIVESEPTERALYFDAALKAANLARLRGANVYELFPFVEDAQSISVLPAQESARTNP